MSKWTECRGDKRREVEERRGEEGELLEAGVVGRDCRTTELT